MKKTVKVLGIIAIALVIGFSIPACSSDDSYYPPDPPKTFIEVSNIPSTYNNMVGTLVVSIPGSSIVVFSTQEKISGNSSTFPLYNWWNEEPWTGDGIYNITILISRDIRDAAKNIYVYTGVTTEASIAETTNTIPWSSFTNKPMSRSNILNAYFQKKATRGVKF